MAIEPLAYLRYFLALGFVLLLIWGGAWVVKRGLNLGIVAKSSQNDAIKVQEIKAIDARHKLVRVQYHDQEYLILLGHNHAMRLAPFSDQETTSGQQTGLQHFPYGMPSENRSL